MGRTVLGEYRALVVLEGLEVQHEGRTYWVQADLRLACEGRSGAFDYQGPYGLATHDPGPEPDGDARVVDVECVCFDADENRVSWSPPWTDEQWLAEMRLQGLEPDWEWKG